MNKPNNKWLIVLATAVALSACGGGGSAGNAGQSTTAAATVSKELASGVVTGFGSVIVEGVKYDDRNALVSLEHDPSAPKSGSIADVKLGMQIELQADSAGQASSIVVSAEVIGLISSKTADGFVVLGQTVKVSADTASPTVFEGFANLTDLAPNDRVEVHGQRDANNLIVASRIERIDPSAAMLIRVAGTVGLLDATAKTFSLAGLTVNYTTATRIAPTAASLTDGARVAVWTDTGPAGTVLTAKTIDVKSGDTGNSDSLRIGGRVAALDFASKRFKLNGIAVDAASATLQNGTANDLANGRKVRVTGTFNGGKLVASVVRLVRDQGDANVDLTGEISDFVASNSFKVRGVPIDASGGAVQFVGGSAANLANGVSVHLVGQVSNNVVTPSRIELVSAPTPGLRTYYGTVSNHVSRADSASDTFSIVGVDAQFDTSVSFRHGDGSAASRGEFGNIEHVKVRGYWSSNKKLVVREVEFHASGAADLTLIEGSVYELNASTRVFKVNGITVNSANAIVDDRRQGQGLAQTPSVQNGVRVEVQGTMVNGTLLARSIEVRVPNTASSSCVRGEISAYESIAAFTVNGQRVDASAAKISNGLADATSVGHLVEVKGPIVNGVLKADNVQFKN